MKTQIKNCLLVTFFALMTMFSCQNEETEFIGPDETETIEANSTLANFMRSASANSVSSDNVLDNSDCFSVELPVTIVVSDITITITTQDDLEELEDLLEDLEVDVPEFIFPITIIYSDYTELVIENQDQLDALLEQCFDEDDTIECIDFVYPISFSVFNSEFVIIDTIVIESDEELYDFLERLEDEDDTLIVSLNFPVTLEYENGETITVDSNLELSNAIQAAAEACDDDNYIPCSLDDIRAYLKECSWDIDVDFVDDLNITFGVEGNVVITSENLPNNITGNWSVTETDTGTYLVLTELSAFQEDLGGEWLIIDCRDDHFEILKGDVEIDLDRDCETDINCSAQDIVQRLRTCYWFSGSNLINTDDNKLKFTENNTVLYYNSSSNEFINVGTWAVTVVGSERKIEFDLAEPFAALSGFWTVTACEEGFIGLVSGDNVLHLEQECFDTNPFECFNPNGYVLEKCDEDGDGFAQFNIYEAVPNCNPSEPIMITFHTTVSGAESNSDYLENATSYTNVSNPQTVYVKVALVSNPNEFIVYPVELIVSDCSNNSCTEEEVDGILMQCTWKVALYNGSDDLAIYKLSFNAEQELVITNTATNETSTGAWATFTGETGVDLTLENIAVPNLQAISGLWTVVECTPEQLILRRGEDEIALDRVCD